MFPTEEVWAAVVWRLIGVGLLLVVLAVWVCEGLLAALGVVGSALFLLGIFRWLMSEG